MLKTLRRYTHWLHTQWPAGSVEKLPQVREDGSTNVPGLYITGDLRGVPLLKLSSDTGARAVQTILADDQFRKQRDQGDGRQMLDLVIVGGGVSGMAAALEAKKSELSFKILEANEPFSTIVNFPKGKPIYTYPKAMTPAGDLQLEAEVKEDLVQELRQQTLEQGIQPRLERVDKVTRRNGHFEVHLQEGETLTAWRVILAVGRSGNHRRLDVPGEDKDKVYNRLFDPSDYCDQRILVVGGGDSALETAIALAQCGAEVSLSYRRSEFSRPKPENIEGLKKLVSEPDADVAIETPVSERVNTSVGDYLKERRKKGSVRLLMSTEVKAIDDDEVTLVDDNDNEFKIDNDVVFTMIGREPPLDFLRRCGVKIRGEMHARHWLGLTLFVLFCLFLYNWKAGGSLNQTFSENGWFPHNVPELVAGAGGWIAQQAEDPSTFIGMMQVTLGQPGFYYSLAYTLLVLIFGIRRIRRRKTPYVTVQTWVLTAIQALPLFLLPYFILPYLGNNGFFEAGFAKTVADGLFPEVDYGHGREYWRATGLILAWPLFIWNVFTAQPMMWWLAISVVQTLVFIPLIIYFWGKGAYCGWICSCGALAETLGDAHREKMVHGALWNRVNMVGQAILGIAVVMLIFRIISWVWPESGPGAAMAGLYQGMLSDWQILGVQLNYQWAIDLFLAGVIGYGFYFWFSGRVWCRFACPLAALMHIYARFSRFRILADKKKCITCNVCTSVCHQGIDIMNFANKGLPMEDPECVRCSACVQSCPTGVLQFGQVDRKTGDVIKIDKLAASPVLMREETAQMSREEAVAS